MLVGYARTSTADQTAGLAAQERDLQAAGVDIWGVYPWLDRAPKGRNETGIWWRRHDEYDKR